VGSIAVKARTVAWTRHGGETPLPHSNGFRRVCWSTGQPWGVELAGEKRSGAQTRVTSLNYATRWTRFRLLVLTGADPSGVNNVGAHALHRRLACLPCRCIWGGVPGDSRWTSHVTHPTA